MTLTPDVAAVDQATTLTALTLRPAPRRGRSALGRLRHTWALGLALLILLVIVAWAVTPFIFASGDPLAGNAAARLQAPSLEHLFGTDQFGRDVYTRMVHGARSSIGGAFIAVLLGLGGGVVLGLLAGFLGGWVDDLVTRLGDVALAIPAILLSMAIITALGGGIIVIALAVGIGSIASIARVMRSEVLKVRNEAYVDAARASGVRWYSILWRHVLPNARGPVVVLSALEFAGALLAIAGLSFLGYGERPPSPEWGSMISEGRDFLATAWWLTTVPGLVVVVVVLAVSQIARFTEGRRFA